MSRFSVAHRRFAAGLAVALAVGLGAEYALFARLRTGAAEAKAEREATVSV